MYKFSIITVCKNCESNLEETIKSVLNQTFSKFEYIIIDGKSSDSTLNIINKYNVKYISEPDTGIYNAMNKGVLKASGEYIYFLNAGDIFSSANVVQYVNDNLYSDIGYGDIIKKFDKGQYFVPAGQVDHLAFTMPFSHQSIFTKRKLLLKRPYDESYKISADQEFYLWCYLQGYKFQYLNIAVAIYDTRGISSTNIELRNKEQALIIKKYHSEKPAQNKVNNDKTKSDENLAPLILFVYNRPFHTQKTIESLAKNTLAKKTRLIIFSDAEKDKASAQQVAEVRKYIHSDFVKKSFAKVYIMEAKVNKGLANSIICGVSDIINMAGKAIVIEDDNIAARDFLSFMNDCLNFYEDDKNIWSIGAFNRTNIPLNYKHDVYIIGRTCSCAWATWKDRWDIVDWKVSDYNKFKHNIFQRLKFDNYGNDRSNMLDRQMNGFIDSWAIRFCYAEFKNKMFTVIPCKTKIENIGFDGSGTHCKSENNPLRKSFSVELEVPDKYKLLHLNKVDKKIKHNFANMFNCKWNIYWLRYFINNPRYKKIAKLYIQHYKNKQKQKFSKLCRKNTTQAVMVQYEKVFGNYPNLEHPKTINEKLQVLKLGVYSNNKLITNLIDKVNVKDYIHNNFSENEIKVARIIAIFNSVREFAKFDEKKLPKKFVIKCNHGCGYNYICKDKSKFNKKQALKVIKKWFNEDYWTLYAEPQYKDIEKKIFIEEYLGNNLSSYKFLCFNGIPKIVIKSAPSADFCVIMNAYFDMEWNELNIHKKHIGKFKNAQEKPENFEKMKNLAKKMSKQFPFVRVDIYNLENSLYLSEFTFLPTGGYMDLQPKSIQTEWGKWLSL